MYTKTLTLDEVNARQQCLNQESMKDEQALRVGHIDKSEAIARSVNREFEQRWLEMEAILLKSNIFASS